MKIYRLDRITEEYGSLEINSRILIDAFGKFAYKGLHKSTQSIASKWPSCSGAYYDMYSLETKEITDIPDIYLWHRSFLVLSAKAKELLETTLGVFGEFLSFKHHGIEHFLFSSFSLIEADKDKSESLVEGGLTIGIKSLVFPPENIGTHPLFKSNFDRCNNLYCTETVKNKLLNSDLTLGVTFSEDLAQRNDA